MSEQCTACGQPFGDRPRLRRRGERAICPDCEALGRVAVVDWLRDRIGDSPEEAAALASHLGMSKNTLLRVASSGRLQVGPRRAILKLMDSEKGDNDV